MKKYCLNCNCSNKSTIFNKGYVIKLLSTLLFSMLIHSQSIAAVADNAQKKVTIETSTITLSGLSAGGYMATQFHLSHPELVSGLGIIAAGPYGCARNSIMTALSECVNKAPNEYPASITDIGSQFTALAKALKDDKVWILHGTLDTRIVVEVVDALHKQYAQLIQTDNLIYINDKPFSHLFPTENTGVKCDTSETPFIGNCGYDAAGALLKHVIGYLQPKTTKTDVKQLGQLIKFEQAELTNLSSTGMHQYGYAYVPESCRINSDGKACSLHVSFHGCNQSIDNVNDQYVKNTGLNEWAATNSIVVLYPQVAKSTLLPMNPQACWDWWGYTDENYNNKDGKQIKAVTEMVLGLEDYLNM